MKSAHGVSLLGEDLVFWFKVQSPILPQGQTHLMVHADIIPLTVSFH
jgi:hypothetical protein